jgi:hypothetical protein
MNTQTTDPAYQQLLNILSNTSKSRPTVGRIRKIVGDDVARILDGIPDQALIGSSGVGRVLSTHIDNNTSIHFWIFNIFGERTYNRY